MSKVEERPTIDSVAEELSFDVENLEGQQEEQHAPAENDESADDSAEGDDAEEESDVDASPATWGAALGIDDDLVDVDDKGNLSGIVVKIDGKTSKVPVKDLIAGYQLNKHLTQKAQLISEEKRQFDQEKTALSDALKEKLEYAAKLNEALKKSLTADFDRINWQKLRSENPGEYAARMEDYRARQAHLDKIDQVIGNENNSLTEEQQRAQQAWLHNYLSEQKAILISENKEWQDDSKFNAALAKLGEQAGAEYGITPQEFYELTDARYVKILMDAIAFRTGKQAVAKKVMNVPKFQKPSTVRPSQSKKSADRELQLIKQARNSRRSEDKIAAAAAILDNAFNG